jgi:hypothetical protein
VAREIVVAKKTRMKIREEEAVTAGEGMIRSQVSCAGRRWA